MMDHTGKLVTLSIEALEPVFIGDEMFYLFNADKNIHSKNTNLF